MTTLEQKIFDYIEQKYEVQFLGTVTVEITPFDYTLKLVLNNYMNPLYIAMGTTDENKFFEFICKEIQQRDLRKVGYYRLTSYEK